MSTASTDRTPPPQNVRELAAWVSRSAPRCGPVRLVGIDGHAGSGKTTLALKLSARCDGAPVVHVDDIARHEELFSWTARFTAQVLDPLARGTYARYPVYDWVTRTATRQHEVPPAPVVIVEGVGAGRRALRPFLSALVWLDLPPVAAWRRGRRRDGPEQADFWNTWIPAEQAHFDRDPTAVHAHCLARPSATDGEGFDVAPGPAYAAAGPPAIEG